MYVFIVNTVYHITEIKYNIRQYIILLLFSHRIDKYNLHDTHKIMY